MQHFERFDLMRALTAVLPAALVFCGAFAAAAFADGPPPVPALLSVTDVPTVVQNPDVMGRDGTYSLAINGISYWAFNDTALFTANASGENFFSNSLSWSTSLTPSPGIVLNGDQLDSSGLPTQFIPFTAQEAKFNASHAGNPCKVSPCGVGLAIWPGPVVYNPANQQVLIPFGLIIRGGPVSGFQSAGAGIAVGTVMPGGGLAMTRPTQGNGTDPALLWPKGTMAFTDQAFIYNGYYYAYGGKNVFVTTEDLLARVPVDQVLNLAAWSYYAGNETWSSDVSKAVPLFDGSASGSSVFFDQYLNEWVAIFSGNFSNNIYYAVANAPEGPWSTSTLLATGRTGYNGNVDYAGRAHPEYSPDNGRTEYVTYVHSIPGFIGQNLPTIKVVFGPGQ
jgi:hypothetical protein